MISVPDEVFDAVASSPPGVASLAANYILRPGGIGGSRMLVIIANPLAAEQINKALERVADLETTHPEDRIGMRMLVHQLTAAMMQGKRGGSA